MKGLRVVLPVVVGGLVLLVGLSMFVSWRKAQVTERARLELRMQMIERSAVARGAAGTPGVEEARAALGWWFASVAKLPGAKGGAAKAAVPAAKKGGPDQAKGKESPRARDDEEMFSRYASERLQALKSGYSPVLSGVDQGIRLDILSIQPGESPDTKERALKIEFALWGVPRRLDTQEEEGSRAIRRVVVPVSFRSLAFRFIDTAGKTYGEMTGSGEPYIVIKDPDRFSAELPPGVSLGTWWVEPFPREAARVEISLSVQVMGISVASLNPSFRFDVPVPDDWKLRQGESFKAMEREADPEPPQEKAPRR